MPLGICGKRVLERDQQVQVQGSEVGSCLESVRNDQTRAGRYGSKMSDLARTRDFPLVEIRTQWRIWSRGVADSDVHFKDSSVCWEEMTEEAQGW